MQELTRIRSEQGWSQQRLAEESGVNKATINQIERGRRSPNVDTLEKLAAALSVEVGDFFPKAQAPLPDFDRQRRAGTTDADIINSYEGIAHRYRLAWRGALEDIADPWEERLRAGAFDRSMVEQFFSDVAALSKNVSEALDTNMDEERLRWQYKGLPSSEEDVQEMWHSAISPAGLRLLEVCEKVWDAAAQRFTQSELEVARQKHDEARLALRPAA